MRQRRGNRGWIGWALGVLAALTLALAAPQHVLDFDEAAGPAAEAQVATEIHGAVHTVLDHAAPGHACAGHCAAHVIGGPPLPARIPKPVRTALIWPAAAQEDAAVYSLAPFDRPPKA